jgi:predicted nucleic acid-binding protein
VTYVIDAAVAVKWFCPEPLSTEACSWMAIEADRIAPDLLLVECANVFRRKIKEGEMLEDHAARALSALAAGSLRLVPTRTLVAEALTLACRLDHPVYDCVYLECARQSGGVLVTADEAFLKRAQARGFAEAVQWLAAGPGLPPTPAH